MTELVVARPRKLCYHRGRRDIRCKIAIVQVQEHAMVTCLVVSAPEKSGILYFLTSAVHNSRKTVVVMSQNYRQSYWCMFEYNMARMESIYLFKIRN
jgi:hypothetical protein